MTTTTRGYNAVEEMRNRRRVPWWVSLGSVPALINSGIIGFSSFMGWANLIVSLFTFLTLTWCWLYDERIDRLIEAYDRSMLLLARDHWNIDEEDYY